MNYNIICNLSNIPSGALGTSRGWRTEKPGASERISLSLGKIKGSAVGPFWFVDGPAGLASCIVFNRQFSVFRTAQKKRKISINIDH